MTRWRYLWSASFRVSLPVLRHSICENVKSPLPATVSCPMIFPTLHPQVDHLDKHLRTTPLADAAAHDIQVQKLFAAACFAVSGAVLYHVAQEISVVKWAGIATIIGGLVYSVLQGWKLIRR
jgi:hypothetical protein